MTALIALAAFFAPIFSGLLVPYSVSMPGVWLTAAICEAPVCQAFGQPFAFVAAVLSMLLAALAVGVSRPYPPARPSRPSRPQRRVIRAFRREVGEDAELAPRIWNAPRPRLAERNDPGDERAA